MIIGIIGAFDEEVEKFNADYLSEHEKVLVLDLWDYNFD